MPNTDIYGLMSVKGGQKQKIMNFSNAREKTYAQYQQLTDAQKKGVIIVDDYPIPEESDSVSVTADGVKTYKTLLNELYALIDNTKLSSTTYIVFSSSIFRYSREFDVGYSFFLSYGNENLEIIDHFLVHPSDSLYTESLNGNISSYQDGVATSGTTITLVYDYYKNLDIHTEYLAKNCMLTGGGNVEDELDDLNTKYSGIKLVYFEQGVNVTADTSTDTYIDFAGHNIDTSTILNVTVAWNNPSSDDPTYFRQYMHHGYIYRMMHKWSVTQTVAFMIGVVIKE